METMCVNHPLQVFSENDDTDYSIREKYFVQFLQSMETVMDIDAYIIDYKNQCILYITKGGSLYAGNRMEDIIKCGLGYYGKIMNQQDIAEVNTINAKAFDFFFSLPITRRKHCYFTQDFVIRNKSNKPRLINHRFSVLDLTVDGVPRLGLCLISYPTNDKPGNAYIKMTDTSTVYEYLKPSGKFVEVKTQKLTSKATTILKLASAGKTEAEMAARLGITIDTVKYHKKRIFAQTGAKNIAEAIQWMNNQKKVMKRL